MHGLESVRRAWCHLREGTHRLLLQYPLHPLLSLHRRFLDDLKGTGPLSRWLEPRDPLEFSAAAGLAVVEGRPDQDEQRGDHFDGDDRGRYGRTRNPLQGRSDQTAGQRSVVTARAGILRRGEVS